MAGNVSGLHVFATDVGPEPLANLDTNYSALVTAINTLATYTNYYLDAGAVNALAFSVAGSQLVSYTDSLLVCVKCANTTNSGTVTLNINALGAVPVKTYSNGVLTAGSLQAGNRYLFSYDATNNVFRCLNPTFDVGLGFIVTTAPAQILFNGPLAGTPVDMTPDSGFFTGTPTGGTGFSPATVTVIWRRMGNFVGMTVPATIGTSNATTFTITGTLPSAILPTTPNKYISVPLLENNTTVVPSGGFVSIASGVLTFGFGLATNTWTASGSKGVSAQINFVYSLD